MNNIVKLSIIFFSIDIIISFILTLIWNYMVAPTTDYAITFPQTFGILLIIDIIKILFQVRIIVNQKYN